MMLISKYRFLLPIAVASMWLTPALAQEEGPTPTQMLISVETKDAKTPVALAASSVMLKVDNKQTPVSTLTRVRPNGAEVALLIDDGLRWSAGRELQDMQKFIQSLPAGTEVFVGYMQNGRVVPVQNFTTDFAAAAKALRIPQGLPGGSASPYLCLSDFVKRWPGAESDSDSMNGPVAPRKARFVMMITNGVDPYNGSTSILNQDSPYVAAAVTDAQRAGIPVYSIYFGDAGYRGGQASFSGQSYLAQVADGTGGRTYYEGTGSPVSLSPYFKEFQQAIAETYIATFDAPGRKEFVNVKMSTNVPDAKLRAAAEVRPGTRISGAGQ
jgi:hypothetical protein